MAWIDLPQDVNEWPDLVNKGLNFQGS